MKPLIVLIVAFFISCIIFKIAARPIDFQLAGRIAMASMLIFTAIGHFAFSKGMSAMLPDFVPYKTQMVFATGILEVAFGIGLLFPKYHLVTGVMIIAFFILVLPANIRASILNINYQTGELNGHGLSYLWFRIPLQLFFIAWVYLSAVRN